MEITHPFGKLGASRLLPILFDHDALQRHTGLSCYAPQGPCEMREAVATTVPDDEGDLRTLGRRR
jgi:hypothetical protein